MLLRCLEDRDRLVQLSDVAEHGSAVKQCYAQLQHAPASTLVASGRQLDTLLPGLDGRPQHGPISRTLRLQQQRLPLPLQERDLPIASTEMLLVSSKEIQRTVLPAGCPRLRLPRRDVLHL